MVKGIDNTHATLVIFEMTSWRRKRPSRLLTTLIPLWIQSEINMLVVV